MIYMNKETFDLSEGYDSNKENEYVEIDENIAMAISILNKNGYTTEFCCGGHPYIDELYSNEVLDRDEYGYDISSPILFYVLFNGLYNFNDIDTDIFSVEYKTSKDKENELESISSTTTIRLSTEFRKTKKSEINSYDKSFDIIKYINLSFLEYVKSLPNAKDRRLFNTLFEAKTQKDE